MKNWQLILTASLIFTTSAFGSITAYFNQNQSHSYTDPYRNIRRHGDNLEAVLLQQITAAKSSIYVAVQEFRLPLVAQALIDKLNAGVDVRVIIEHDYNFDVTSQRENADDNEHEASRLNDLRAFVDMNGNGRFEKNELETRDAIYMFKKAHMPMMDDTFDSSKGSGLMHHKFMVVDNKTVVFGSANFTMSCVHGDSLAPNSRGNSNSLVVVNSLDFANIFVEEYSQLWGNGRRGNFGHNKTYRGPQTVNVHGVKLTVQFSPTSQRYNWEESTNGLIAAHLSRATQSIQAALFVFSDQKLSNVMEKSQANGAKIGVIIEPQFAYRDYSELLDMLGVRMLNNKCAYNPLNRPWKVPAREIGVARLERGDVLHHKFAVVDGRTTIIGSENWSDSANYTNDETLVVIEGKGISDSYGQEYERIKQTAALGLTSSLKSQISRLERSCSDEGQYY